MGLAPKLDGKPERHDQPLSRGDVQYGRALLDFLFAVDPAAHQHRPDDSVQARFSFLGIRLLKGIRYMVDQISFGLLEIE